MTKPRAVVSEALADRGRPELWATEEESAALSGMSPCTFTVKLPALEAKGFPPRSAWNDKRYIPAIEEFWRKEHRSTVLPVTAEAREDEERGKENWGNGKRQRQPA